MNSNDPRIDPCGTAYNNSRQKLYTPPTVTLYFLLVRSSCTRFNDFISKPHALSLATKSSGGRQPKASETNCSNAQINLEKNDTLITEDSELYAPE